MQRHAAAEITLLLKTTSAATVAVAARHRDYGCSVTLPAACLTRRGEINYNRDMSYTALYRKYRPERFSDVIGQEHITETLRNQIRLGRIGHAYLFTGSRGVGKTTCARIFARAINCLGGDGEPCGKCETCQKLIQPNNLDIIEIDAASNNGVDEARGLKERVKYPPVNGRYKVFIIDEAHMLTGGAANALLKTLEEPPEYVVFILATTEAHKLPATVLSRCMRFDFRLVSLEALTELLEKVAKEEGKEYEPEALGAIALAGEGSVRDTLSVADKCFSASTGKLTYDDVLKLLGGSDESSIASLFRCMINSDINSALVTLSAMLGAGKSPAMIAKSLTTYSRNVLIAKAAPKLLTLPDARKEAIMRLSEQTDAAAVVSIMEIFDKTGGEMRLSPDPALTLETAVFKACKLFGLDFSSLETRVARLEKRLDEGNFASPASVIEKRTTERVAETAAAEKNEQKKPVENDKTEESGEKGGVVESEAEGLVKDDISKLDPRVVWGRILTYMRTAGYNIVYSLFAEQKEYRIEDGTVIICAENKDFLMLADNNTLEVFDKTVKALGYDLKLKIISPSSDRERELEKIKRMIGDAPIKIID